MIGRILLYQGITSVLENYLRPLPPCHLLKAGIILSSSFVLVHFSMSPVATHMQSVLTSWEETADGRAIFLNCYLLMTRNMFAAVDAAEFHDPIWVSQLLHRFADYYFEALTAYEQEAEHTPIVWRMAHDAARQNEVMVVQQLMLGINAHINYDLVLVLVDMLEGEWAGLDTAARLRRYEDHCHVNEIIQRTMDAVQDDVVRHHAPFMGVVDVLLGPLDEFLAGALITDWRDEVWERVLDFVERHAVPDRTALAAGVAETAVGRAHSILLKSLP